MDVHVLSTYFITIIDPHFALYASIKYEVPVFYNCLELSQPVNRHLLSFCYSFIYSFIQQLFI